MALARCVLERIPELTVDEQAGMGRDHRAAGDTPPKGILKLTIGRKRRPAVTSRLVEKLVDGKLGVSAGSPDHVASPAVPSPRRAGNWFLSPLPKKERISSLAGMRAGLCHSPAKRKTPSKLFGERSLAQDERCIAAGPPTHRASTKAIR